MVRVIALLLTLAAAAPLAAAKDYTVKLGPEKGDADYRSRGLQDRNFDPSKDWEHWGSTARDEGNFPNNSSKTMKAIHFRVRFPANSDRPRFSPQSTGGGLFREVWMNADRTEILFRNISADVKPNDYFWMKVTPTTNGAPGGYYQFEAFAYESNPPVPASGGWVRLGSSTTSTASVYESSQDTPESARRQFFGTAAGGYTSHFNFDNRVFPSDTNPPRTKKYNCLVECRLASGVTRYYSKGDLNEIDVNDWRTLPIDAKKVRVVRCRFYWSLAPNGRLEKSAWVNADDGMYISYVFLVWHGNNDYTIESLTQEPLPTRPAK